MEKKYFNSFQILRVIAFVIVYFYHNIYPYEACKWAVCVFFMLGGFLDILHYYDNMPGYGFRDSISFGIKRIKKIYPLHVIMTLGACIMYELSRRQELTEGMPGTFIASAVKLISNLTLVSGWIPTDFKLVPYFGEYNIPSWYLSVCLLFYMLLPLIIKIMHGIYDGSDSESADDRSASSVKRPVTAIFLIFLFVLILNLIHVAVFGKNRAFWYNYESPLSRIGDYLIGAQIGYIYMRFGRGHRLNKWIFGIMAVINAAAFVICLNFGPEHIWLASTGFYFSLPVAGLILFMALSDADFETALRCRALKPVYVWAALTGYAYLIHVPVINGVHSILKRLGEVKLPIWVAISFFLTLGFAYIYSRIIGRKKHRTADRG